MSALKVLVIRTEIPENLKKKKTDYISDHLILWYVKRNKERFDRVFFFDAYDVFFEYDLFQYLEEDKIYFTQEGNREIITEPYNSKWINDCFDQEILENVGRDYIICSGTVGGSTTMFIRFYSFLTSQKSFNSHL